MASGNELDPTRRFSNRVEDYVRSRPDYPGSAIDAILAGIGDPRSIVAADVGAGTGIASRQLANRGVRVWAIEPNREMRTGAESHPRVAWIGGTAEATGLAPSSVDLVLTAQAFHWFRQPEAIAEFHRILRPQGRLAIVWNRRDREDPFTRSYVEAIDSVHGESEAERREFDPHLLVEGGQFDAPILQTFPHQQVLDRAGLRGRAGSASYVPKEGPAYAELLRILDLEYERHRDARGLVTMRYRTDLWIATSRAPGGADSRAPQAASEKP